MSQISSNFHVSCFRHRVGVWTLLAILLCSLVPSVSLAQQPTATIKTLSGNVLVSGRLVTAGTALQTGDTIQTQAGASMVLELSDGSEIHLEEKTQINIADLAQTATGARISSIKLLAGRLRALLSPGHQQEGSSFTIETPNALLGVKFSEPDIEVSYNPDSIETIGIAHTVELMAKNLLTDEEVLIPVGSSVIIVGTTMKIVAGILAIAGATESGTTGTAATEAVTTGTSSTGSSGMGVGTKVALGVGAAAAAGSVVALTGSSDEGSDDGIVESIEDLSGVWVFSGSCIAQGCTADLVCAGPPEAPLLNCCGMDLCNCCELNVGMEISQSGNILSGRILSAQGNPEGSTILNGTVNVSSVLFTIQPDGIMPVGPTAITQYTGTIEDSAIIRGTFSGSGYHPIVSGGTRLVIWSGTFTATIRKE